MGGEGCPLGRGVGHQARDCSRGARMAESLAGWVMACGREAGGVAGVRENGPTHCRAVAMEVGGPGGRR
jgi:hypothetical protein